jgi:type IV pilus assembly protein PilB
LQKAQDQMAVKKIGELLVDAGLISDKQLDSVLAEIKKNKGLRIGAVLVKKGYTTELDIAETLAYQLNIPFVDISSYPVDSNAVNLINEKLAQKYHVLPLCRNHDVLKLAMADPLDLNAINDVRFSTGLQPQPCVATPSDIADAMRIHYNLSQPINDLIDDLSIKKGTIEVIHDADSPRDIADHVRKSSAPPIIKMVDSIIIHGLENGASDVHLEPQQRWVKVRIRVDGLMRESMQLPKWVQGPIVSRIKLMSGMDIAERRICQDGKIKVRIGDKALDIRVSTLPTQYGETVVMRILDPKAAVSDLNSVGFLKGAKKRVIEMTDRPQGVVIVTGPTGSGKTSTLYAMIETIRGEEINIITIEDPIEFELKGVNQVSVNEKTGLTFSYTLRSVLRQDPDVILIGEIRDSETAMIGFQASMTGHLVFSTLHTNDAVSSISRLRNMGLPSYLIASSLNGIIAQRLVRKICPQCKEEYTPSGEEISKIGGDWISKNKLYRGKGCKRCHGSGYSGRTGVFEVLTISNKIRDMIAGDASENDIAKAAVEAGMTPLHMDGLMKVAAGITTLEELTRVVYLSRESIEKEGICPSCFKIVMPGSELCPHCGHRIKADCNSCGKPMQQDWIICPYCATEYIIPPHRPHSCYNHSIIS